MRENTALIQSLILTLYTLLITNTTLLYIVEFGVCPVVVYLCVCCDFVLLYLSLAYLMVTGCKGFSHV